MSALERRVFLALLALLTVLAIVVSCTSCGPRDDGSSATCIEPRLADSTTGGDAAFSPDPDPNDDEFALRPCASTPHTRVTPSQE